MAVVPREFLRILVKPQQKASPFRKALRRTFSTHPNLTMLWTGLMTFVFGLLLLRPGDTFATSPSYDVLAKASLGPIHPDESGWGAIIATLGISMLIGWWFLCQTQDILEDYALEKAKYPEEHWLDMNLKSLPSYGYNIAVWSVGGAVWFLLAGSFFLANPLTTALAPYVIYGVCASAFNVIRLHHLREAATD